LDPKCSHPDGSHPDGFVPQQAKPSIINLAINGGTDSFVNQVNITEEMTKCAIWKNLQSAERPQDIRSTSSSGSSKRLVCR